MKNRDYNLDFFRGIAAIWIIFIHTCFWSGGYYLSDYIRSFSLIIDVPVFMFISGATFNYSNSVLKTIKGIIKIWYKYLIFLILYFGILFIIDSNYLNLNNILNSIFFNFTANKLMVVEGSFWFIFMYFVVSLIGSSIICVYNKYSKDLKDFKYIILLVFILYGMSLFNSSFIFISSNNLMYLLLFLLGYYLYKMKINIKKLLLIIFLTIILCGILLKITSFNITDMQLAKSSSHFLYLVYSLISINIVMLLKDRIKISAKNAFVKIGENALLFYFCQGIGSSLIYYLYPYINGIQTYLILVIMFVSNVLITIICVYLIRLIQFFVDNFINIINKTYKKETS